MCEHLFLPLVRGHVKITVVPSFLISGVRFILGNDLAGENVFPLPKAISYPISFASACCPTLVTFDGLMSNVFPECAITCAQALKMSDCRFV